MQDFSSIMTQVTDTGIDKSRTAQGLQNDEDTGTDPNQNHDEAIMIAPAQTEDPGSENDTVGHLRDDYQPPPKSLPVASSMPDSFPPDTNHGRTNQQAHPERHNPPTGSDIHSTFTHDYGNTRCRTNPLEPAPIGTARDSLLRGMQQLSRKQEQGFLLEKMNVITHEKKHDQNESQDPKKRHGNGIEDPKADNICTQQLPKTSNSSAEAREVRAADMQKLRNERDDAIKDLELSKRQRDVSEREHQNVRQRLEAATRKAERKSQELCKVLRTVQENAARNGESAQWMPQPATEVERRFDSILKAIKRWSEKRVRVSKSKDPSRGVEAASERYLQDIVPVWNRSSASSTVPGKLLLAAAVSNYAFRNIIGDVFFLFRNPTNQTQCTDVYDKKSGETLTTLIKAIGKSDVAGAQAWRCKLMRLLDPPSSNTAAIEEIKMRTERALGESAQMLAKEFLEQMQDLIQEHTSDQVFQELYAIFGDCARLAKNLSVQKYEIKIVGLECLDVPYEPGSEWSEPHGTHTADLEDNPQALNGRRIKLFINPAIVFYGTAAGCDYEQHRVWKKATVLIES